MSEETFGELSLLVEKSELNGETGVRTFYVRVHEKLEDGSELTGPLCLYGIDIDALNNAYAGSYEKFLLEKVKEREIMRYRGLRHGSTQAESLHGEKI